MQNDHVFKKLGKDNKKKIKAKPINTTRTKQR